MAGVRELYLIIRARSEVRGALGAVRRDIRALPDVKNLQVRRAQLESQRGNLQAQQAQVISQRESLLTGERFLALQQKRLVAEKAIRNVEEGSLKILRAEEDAQIRLLEGERVRLARMSRVFAARTKRSAGFPESPVGKEAAAAIEGQTRRVANTRQEIEGLNRAYVEQDAVMKDAALRLQRVGAAETAAAAKAGVLASKAANLGESMKRVDADIDGVNQRMREIPLQRMQTLANAVGHLGRVMATFGAIGAAGFGLAARSAAEFGKQATLAATQTGTSLDAIRKYSSAIQTGVLKQMQQFPAASADMTKGFYDILSSMNRTVPQTEEMMKTFNQAAVAGVAPLNDVVNAGITILNDYGDQGVTTTQAMDKMIQTVITGRLTVQQYTTTMNQLVPAFQSAGQSIDSMNGAIATLTRLMPSQRMAATATARLVEQLGRSREDFRGLGIDITDVNGRLLPFNEVIRKIATSNVQLVRNLISGRITAQQFFKTLSGTTGTIQASRALTFFIRNYKQLDENTKTVTNSSGVLAKTFKALQETPANQWARFTNTLQAFAIVIGQGVIPALETIGNALLPVMNRLNQMSPHTKRLIGYFGAFIAIATTAIGVLLVFAGGLAGLILRFIALQPVIAGAIAGMRGYTAVTAIAAAETGAISFAMAGWLVAIAALVIAIPFINKLTGGWMNTILLLTQAVTAFIGIKFAARMAVWVIAMARARLGMAALAESSLLLSGTLVAIGAVAVIATWKIARGFERAQKTMLDAENRATHFSDTAVRGIGRQINAMLNQGKTSKQIMDIEKRRYGDSLQSLDLIAAGFVYATERGEVYNREQERAARNAARNARTQRELGTGRATGLLSDPEALRAAQRLANMQAAAQAMAPGPRAFEAWTRYSEAVAIFKKRTTDAQRAIIDMMNIQANQKRLTDAQVVALQHQIDAARKAFEQTPTHANWIRWWRLMDQLSREGTDKQKQYAADMEQTWTKSVTTISDTAALAMARNVERLNKIAGTAPTLDNWNRYYKARQAADKAMSDRQKEITQGILSAAPPPTINDAEFRRQYAVVEQIHKQATEAIKRDDADAFRLSMQYHIAEAKLQKIASAEQMAAANDLAKIDVQATTISNAEFRRRYAAVERLHKRATDAIKRGDKDAFDLSLQYHLAESKLQKVASSEQMSAIGDVTAAREKANKDAMYSTRRTVYDIARSLTSAFENIKQETQQALGTLFQGPFMQSAVAQVEQRFGIDPTGSELLRDLQMQGSRLQTFVGSMGRLRQRGAPKELVDQIRELGPESQKNVNQLLQMTPQQWRRYITAFNANQRLVNRIAQQRFQEQIREMRRHGRNMALALIQGMRSQNVALENAMRQLVQRMFPGLARKGGLAAAGAGGGGGGSTITYNYTIHAGPGAHVTLPTQLRKLHVQDRARRGPHAR